MFITFLLLYASRLNVALGQENFRPETVTTRIRPELDPIGLGIGGFRSFPQVTLLERYNDNIFAVDRGEESDFITVIKPDLALESGWSNHALNLRADATIGRYADNNDENYEDFTIGTNGRLDFTATNQLSLGASYSRLHEARDSPDDVEGIEPTIYKIGSVFTTYKHKFSRLSVEAGATFDQIDFDDVDRLTDTGSTETIENDGRDRDEVEGVIQLNYELLPQYTAFLRGAINSRDYDGRVNGIDRSSNGYEVNVGTDLFFSGVMFGELFFGFLRQDPDDPVLDTIDGISGGLSLTWLPTGLTTVTASVTREVDETIVGVASGILSTEAEIVVDHELLRNLLLKLNVSYIDDEFEGVDRDDQYIKVGFGAKYLMNRYLNLFLQYDYVERDSNSTGGFNDFTQNVGLVGIVLQM